MKSRDGIFYILMFMLIIVISVLGVKLEHMTEYSNGVSDSLKEMTERYTNLLNSYEVLIDDYTGLEEKYKKLEEDHFKGATFPQYNFTKEDIDILAKCVECEAGDPSVASEGQLYVAEVILNRVKSTHFPDSVAEVVYQRNGNIPQFSVAYNGMMDKCVPKKETYLNIYKVLMFEDNLPDYVLYFYSASVQENWVNSLNTYIEVNHSVFAYSDYDYQKECL